MTEIIVVTPPASPTIVVDPTRGGAIGPPGPSAYDIAVTNGFVGTEAEWLAAQRAGMGYWTLLATSSTTFPARSSIPVWWTGPVLYDSTLYLNHPDPTDQVAGDQHIKRTT